MAADPFASLVAAQAAQRAATPAKAPTPVARGLSADEVREVVFEEIVGMLANRATTRGRRNYRGAVIR